MQEVLLPPRMHDGVSGKGEQCAAERGEAEAAAGIRAVPASARAKWGAIRPTKLTGPQKATNGRHQKHGRRKNGMSQSRYL